MRISKNMLVNTATAFKVIAIDEDRNAIYNEGVTLDSVYVIYNDGQSNGAQGKQPASHAVLYYDVFNSLPLGYRFDKGDKLEIEGNAYYVENIRPFYNADGLQHYEIDLI